MAFIAQGGERGHGLPRRRRPPLPQRRGRGALWRRQGAAPVEFRARHLGGNGVQLRGFVSIILGWDIILVHGLVKFAPAVAYHLCHG